MSKEQQLKEFVRLFIIDNNRIPTQNEIIKGTGIASKTIKSYLVEGVDYAKPLTKQEAAVLGGRATAETTKNPITSVSKKLEDKINNLKLRGLNARLETSKAGGKFIRLRATDSTLRAALGMMYVDPAMNNIKSLKDAEEIRNELITEQQKLLSEKSKLSIADKQKNLEIINARLNKLVQRDLAGTPAKGFLDVRLASMDDLGNVTFKNRGTDFSKALGFSTQSGNVDLTKVSTKEARTIVDDTVKNLFTNIRADAAADGQICSLVRTKKANGGTISCVDAVEDAIQKEPEKLIQKASRLDKFKNAATGFLNLVKKGGKFGALTAAGAATAGVVKKYMNDDPETYLSNEDQQKNLLIEMLTGSLDDTPQERPDILDYQLPALGAAGVAGTAVVAPSTIEASRSGALGAKKRGVTRTAGRTLLRGLGALGTPAGLLATEPLFLAGQVQQGDSLAEIATDPLNYLGAAFVGPVSDYATKGLNPLVAKTMRLGISPTVLKTVSRRFGLPGLALSLGISGYETFDDYRNKRGMFSEK
jgi:23S rRNA maturation mini-RNase III